MYKALEDVGDFKKGDTVPDEMAIVWEKMYKISPVEKISKQKTKSGKVQADSEDEQSSSDVMLDDYLSRNSYVVKKNILTDKLTKSQLNKLLKLEKSDKHRLIVIRTIKQKLKAMNW